MINASRRGVQAAGEVVQRYSQILPASEVQSIAEREVSRMKQAGYAHIEPTSDFIESFVTRFLQLQATA